VIRVLTLNIWQEQGPWEQRLELLSARLAQLAPDVVCLQEVRQVAGRIPNQAETLASRLDLAWTFEIAQPWGGGEEGLAILSRLPIAERDACELPYTDGRSRRVCLGAALRAERGTFWVFTTHLAWRLADGALREQQVLAVDRFVQAHTGKAATILTGDFNATPDADELRYLRGLTSLEGGRTYYQDAFALRNPGAPGHTWCSENPYTAALGWLERDRRLDYILVTPMTREGAGAIRTCRVVCTEPDERGVWCSDHYGVLAEIDVFGR
jgi:endonuclease/exonuclease/phosphatase family metal-dependent hydrolase